jgi:hypothetical protein
MTVSHRYQKTVDDHFNRFDFKPPWINQSDQSINPMVSSPVANGSMPVAHDQIVS